MVITLPKYFRKQFSRNGFTLKRNNFSGVSSPRRFHCNIVGGFRRNLSRQPFMYHQHPRKLSERPENNFLFNVNPFLEICFQKSFGRVMTNAAALDPAIFVVPKLMSTGGIMSGIIFCYVCYNYLIYPTRFRCPPTCARRSVCEKTAL